MIILMMNAYRQEPSGNGSFLRNVPPSKRGEGSG
jgi:hypothetical protein